MSDEALSGIDADAVTHIRAEVLQALEDVENRLGIRFTVGKGHYTSKNGWFEKLGFAMVAATGEVETKEVTEFKRLAKQYNVDESDLHEAFTHNGTEYVLAGLDPQKKSKSGPTPFLALRTSDNKRFWFPRHTIVRYMTERRIREAKGERAPVFETGKMRGPSRMAQDVHAHMMEKSEYAVPQAHDMTWPPAGAGIPSGFDADDNNPLDEEGYCVYCGEKSDIKPGAVHRGADGLLAAMGLEPTKPGEGTLIIHHHREDCPWHIAKQAEFPDDDDEE